MNNFLLTMNVSRRCMDGSVQEDEMLNQSQLYIRFFGQNVIKNCALEYKILRKKNEKIVSILRNQYQQTH